MKRLFTFPSHLTSASAVAGETGNREIASFHLNDACIFAKKHKTQKYHLVTAELIRCQSYRLYGARDSTRKGAQHPALC